MKPIQDIAILRQVSSPVDSVEEALEIIKKLEESLSQIHNGVGLAAIQIGIPKTIGVIKNGDGFVHLINPRLIEGINEFVYFQEGCLSFPNLYRNIRRYDQVVIVNSVIDDGEFREETLTSHYCKPNEESFSRDNPLLCIAIQHELDHFEGKLIIDHEDVKSVSIIREEPKVGRNDQCPCGSKKKYKKCCALKTTVKFISVEPLVKCNRGGDMFDNMQGENK